MVGAGRNIADASEALFVEKKGIKVAFLSFAENEFGIADEDCAGAAPLNPLKNIVKIRETSNRADITIVLIHGGNERNPVPSPRMVQTYRSFADAGASAVIGTHPHCPQGIEIYNGVSIIYSLGNFLFGYDIGLPYSKDNFWWKSFMAKLSFNRNRACVLELIPYTFGPDATGIELIKGIEKDDFLKYINHLSDIIQDEKELTALWQAWCLENGSELIGFLKGGKWPFDFENKNALQEMVNCRNAFTCEAHNELLTTFLKMLCDNKLDNGYQYLPKIKKLKKGIFV